MFHDHPKKNDLVVHNNTRRTFIKMWDQMKNCIALCNLSFHKLGNNLCPFFSSLFPFLSSLQQCFLVVNFGQTFSISLPFLQRCFLVTRGCVTLWPLPFTSKSILRQKKNYGNSNISPFKKIIFKKSSKRNQNTSRYYIIPQLISSFNTSHNIIFQKSLYKNRPITQEPKSLKLVYSVMILNLNTISLPWALYLIW